MNRSAKGGGAARSRCRQRPGHHLVKRFGDGPRAAGSAGRGRAAAAWGSRAVGLENEIKGGHQGVADAILLVETGRTWCKRSVRVAARLASGLPILLMVSRIKLASSVFMV